MNVKLLKADKFLCTYTCTSGVESLWKKRISGGPESLETTGLSGHENHIFDV